MERNNFLDTNIIINYVNFDEKYSNKITRRCYDYISNTKTKIILCSMVISEIYNVMKKRSEIYSTTLQMIKTGNEKLYKNLSNRDIPYVKKLYLQFKEKDLTELEKLFLKERMIFEEKIERFLKFNVDIKVVQINQIKSELVNEIYNFISNYADCKVLASALQYQKHVKTFNFITADGKDFDTNGYEYIKEYFRVNHPKENWKFPELINLIYK